MTVDVVLMAENMRDLSRSDRLAQIRILRIPKSEEASVGRSAMAIEFDWRHFAIISACLLDELGNDCRPRVPPFSIVMASSFPKASDKEHPGWPGLVTDYPVRTPSCTQSSLVT